MQYCDVVVGAKTHIQALQHTATCCNIDAVEYEQSLSGQSLAKENYILGKLTQILNLT